MNAPILLGPILGLESGDIYTVCLLTSKSQTPLMLELADGQGTFAFKKVALVGENAFWRAEFSVPAKPKGYNVAYTVSSGGKTIGNLHGASWFFYVPATDEQPQVLYTSCNGFSTAKLASNTAKPYALWERMVKLHSGKKESGPESGPYSLLLMGGDQVYADEIWETGLCPLLKEWSHLDAKAQESAKVTASLAKEIEDFYNSLYLNRWKTKDMANILASVPSVMMWDDHDIFDGWGSYPEKRHNCDVFQKIFKEAARVYDIFQLRCSDKNRLNPKASHRTLRLTYRDFHILALDNRSERTTNQIMSPNHWNDVKSYLDGLQNEVVKNLLIMSGVPVVYRSFATVEKLFDATPWHEELEDDVQDHWSATSHQAERMKLVMVFLNFLKAKQDKQTTTPLRGILLSGDVHVGALGQIWDASRKVGLTQIISSGIVHPPPSMLAWVGLELMTSDTPEPLGEGDVVAEMLTPIGADRYLRTRNFATLHLGSDQKLWINWVCEDEDSKPSFAIA